MENFIRSCLQWFFRICKVDSVWLKNPRKYPKTVLYVANHVSALDVLFLYAFLPSMTFFFFFFYLLPTVHHLGGLLIDQVLNGKTFLL